MNNPTNSKSSTPSFEVTLDGQSVTISPDRKSLGAIRFYLETLAMEQQRVLSSFKIDGRAVTSMRLEADFTSFRHIDAETTELGNRPSQILSTALLQIANARNLIETAVTQVLINDAVLSREIWWDL